MQIDTGRGRKLSLGATALADSGVRLLDLGAVPIIILVDLTTLVLRGISSADVLTPVVSLIGGTVGPPTVGFVTTWMLFSVAAYTFGPLPYESSTNAYSL
jgi:hypothetical protein